MQRDKRGRFVKKASSGTDLTSFSLNNPSVNQKKALDTHHLLWGDESKPWAPQKIKYRWSNGTAVDEFGNLLNMLDVYQNPHRYELAFDFNSNSENSVSSDSSSISEVDAITNTDPASAINTSLTEERENPSVGFNLFNTEDKNKVQINSEAINRTKLADFLEWTRAGIGASINNKIAQRALEAEKPFLQDVSESHHSVYGDYRARMQGEKAAAQLRNLASRPVTSDGAAQQQMMLEAQIKGQEFIDQGNAQDEAMIKQTREVSWQQEKENQQQRQAAAMQNRQAMLMSEQNKTQIKNMRDSANYSQIVAPLIMGIESRLRDKGAEQEYYQDYYDNLAITDNVWNNAKDYVTPEELELVNKFLSEGETALNAYIQADTTGTRNQNWMSAQHKLKQAIIQRQAALRGVTVRTTTPAQEDPFAFWRPKQNQWTFKSGGTIYKATLQAKSKNKDRNQRSIQSSKKIAARFLEKALNSLYTYNEVELIAKPKKRKYQAGGNLPFVNFSPITGPSTSSAATTKAAEDEDSQSNDLTTKDVLELLKDLDGLPSDINQIIASLQNFTLEDDYRPSYLASSSNIASRYIKLLGQIQTAVFNRAEYKGAIDHLKSNGGLHELAITSDGWLIGVDDANNFKYFNAAQVNAGEHSEQGYSLLTNSNLLYLRANSPDAAFNPALLSAAQNGIGIATVNKLIQDVISHLGTSTESSEGYVKTKQGDLVQGLQGFYEAAQTSSGTFNGTIHDLYKGKLLTKSQAEQAKKAIQYIYLTLPENAKTLLKVKSDGSEEGAVQLIETLISAQLKPEQTFDLDLVGGRTNKSSGSGSGGKDDTDLKTSLPLNVQKGIGGVDSYLQVDRGDGIHLQVRGTQYNLITTPNGEAIQDTSLANMLASSGLQGLVKDLRNIQFGDQKISPEVLASITYNNTGITRANLPIKPDGSVDLDLLEKYEQAEQEIDALSDRSLESVKQIYEKYGLTSLLNADGSYNLSKFGAFMVTEGYTTDALSGLKESEFVKEFQGDTDAAAALIQRCLQVGTGKNAQTPDIDTFAWYNPGDWFGWTDVIYKGVMYIPITNNVNTAVFGANQSLDYDEALIQEEKYQNFEKMSRQKSTDSELLNI